MTAGLAIANADWDAVQPVVAGAEPFRTWIFANHRLDGAELAFLDAEERLHSARLARESDREAFIVSRIALRSILGRACGLAPQDVRFTRNSWGKLSVVGPLAGAIDFSVSHAKGLSVIAVSDGRPVGIDVEKMREFPDKSRIAADVFGDDVAQQLHESPVKLQDVLFLQLWTAAEAFVKAQGVGFAGWGGKVPLWLSEGRSPQVQFRDDHSAGAAARWAMAALLLPPGFIGSLVTGRLPEQHVGRRAKEMPVSTGCG